MLAEFDHGHPTAGIGHPESVNAIRSGQSRKKCNTVDRDHDPEQSPM
jgi:hypothetical protein